MVLMCPCIALTRVSDWIYWHANRVLFKPYCVRLYACIYGFMPAFMAYMPDYLLPWILAILIAYVIDIPYLTSHGMTA